MNYPDELAIEGRPAQPVPARSTERQEFWADTCREMREMRLGSQQCIELYRKFGCRFCTPTLEQAQHVISALDSAVPAWETTYPELFYQTLELNFPELVRHA